MHRSRGHRVTGNPRPVALDLAALASRTAHRIHDALEFAYGEAFTSLAHNQRAALLKALLVHPARWPDDAAALIRDAICAGKHHVSQKDDIRRFLGFGFVEADDAVALGCFPMRPRLALEFSGLVQQHGLAACADFMSAAGTLFPIAPCGRCSL